MTIEVRQATVERVDHLAGVLGRAFASDPLLVWPFRGGAGPDEPRTTATFAILLPHYAHAGALWETEGGDACAVWVPPGRIDIFETMDAATRAPIARMTDDAGARYDALWDWLGSRVPDEPIWFLDLVGVDPASQGRGYGRALVEIGIEGSRNDRVPAFCITSSIEDVRFYEHLGFRVAEHDDAPVGGPHVWFMRREP